MNGDETDFNVEAIKALRKLNKISQKDLAKQAKVALRTITNMESGKRYPSVKNLVNICKILNAKLSIVFDAQKITEKKELKDGSAEIKLFGAGEQTARRRAIEE